MWALAAFIGSISTPGTMTMAVHIRNERTGRWLNLSVCLILIAMIAVDGSAYWKSMTESCAKRPAWPGPSRPG